MMFMGQLNRVLSYHVYRGAHGIIPFTRRLRHSTRALSTKHESSPDDPTPGSRPTQESVLLFTPFSPSFFVLLGCFFFLYKVEIIKTNEKIDAIDDKVDKTMSMLKDSIEKEQNKPWNFMKPSK